MAVEIKYVVIREGEEKMSFTSKKDADAYDRMLDLAEVLNSWLQQSPDKLDDEQRDSLSLWMAEQRDVLGGILKSGKLPGHVVENVQPLAPKKTASDKQKITPEENIASAGVNKVA